MTLALSAGVPMELVAKLETGNSKLGGDPTTKNANTKGESELVALAGKVAAGSATEAEKKRLAALLAGALGGEIGR